MREYPSKSYMDWALERFGSEWVENNLFVECECGGEPFTEVACLECRGQGKRPVEIREALGIQTPSGERMALSWVRERKELIVTDFQLSLIPSNN